jgi:hypothetical protein
VIAGAVAMLKASAPRPARGTPASRSRVLGSFLEDAVTLVGIVVPWLAPVLVALLVSSGMRARVPRARRDGDPRAPEA